MTALRTLARAGMRLPGSALAHLKKHADAAQRKGGSAPGTMVYVGVEREEPVRLSLVTYGPGHHSARGRGSDETVTLPECREALVHAALPDGATTWVNVDGLHDVELVRELTDSVGVHRLVQEDLVHTAQRPKVEEYADHIYLVVRMLEWDAETETLQDEQLSVVLGQGWILTFQERRGDVFKGVRHRLETASGTIRSRGPDYLAYALVDAVVDHYFQVLEGVSDRIEELEVDILENPASDTAADIHRLKREMLAVRRAIWPLREALNQLNRDAEDTALVSADTRVFLRDVYDHAVQVIDTAETLRDLLGGLLDLYLTGVSNRMNETMKVLTIIATIFIPLSFLAGLYGMNFTNMPELQLPWAYPALLVVMAALAGGMLLWFRRKGWIGGDG